MWTVSTLKSLQIQCDSVVIYTSCLCVFSHLFLLTYYYHLSFSSLPSLVFCRVHPHVTSCLCVFSALFLLDGLDDWYPLSLISHPSPGDLIVSPLSLSVFLLCSWCHWFCSLCCCFFLFNPAFSACDCSPVQRCPSCVLLLVPVALWFVLSFCIFL